MLFTNWTTAAGCSAAFQGLRQATVVAGGFPGWDGCESQGSSGAVWQYLAPCSTWQGGHVMWFALLTVLLLAGCLSLGGAVCVALGDGGWFWHCVVLEALAVLVWWATPILPPPSPRAVIRLIKRSLRVRWKAATRKHQASAYRLRQPSGQHVHPSARPLCLRLAALVVLVLLAGSFTVATAAGTAWACQRELYAAVSSNVGYAAMASHMAQHHLSPHVAIWQLNNPQSNRSDRWQAGPAYAAVSAFQPEGVMYPTPHDRYEKDEEGGWVWGHHPDMPAKVMEQLQAVVRARKHTAFAYSMDDLAGAGYCGREPPFEIKLDTDNPIICKQRRYSPAEIATQNEKCHELCRARMIKPAPLDTKWISAATMPAKRDLQGLMTDTRYCIDFRAMNKHTVADKYGMHRPEDLFHKLGAARFYSKLDCRAGFHNIPVAEADQAKTSFWWNNQIWCYTRMPYGLKNASAKFQRVIDSELAAAGLTHCCVGFIDDLAIGSETAEQHVRDVERVLDMLAKVGLRAHPDKSVFGACVLEYLGHNVSHQALTPHQAKVSAIRALRAPTNVSELRSILGFLNYYRLYVPGFSELAAPLNALLKKDAKWCWGPEQAAALEQLKAALCRDGAALKRFDPDAPTKLYTDWSKHGIAAVLSQTGADGKEYLVACVSRSLNKHESGYPAVQGEMLAATWGIKTLRPYLHGLHFTVVTDHQPLKWLCSTPDLTGMLGRWACSLMEYSFTIEHRPGKKHQNADVPSRFPAASSHDGTGARLDPVLGEDPPGSAPPSAQAASGLAPGPDHAAPAESSAAPTTPTAPDTSALATLCGSGRVSGCLLAELSSALHAASLDAVMGQAPVASFMDSFAPSSSRQLQEDMHAFAENSSELSLEDAAWAQRLRRSVLRSARRWVDACSMQLRLLPPAAPLPLLVQPASSSTGSTEVVSINTSSVSGSFFAAADAEGVTLFEPFGGLCAGLDMCLALGLRIKRYLYSDIDPAARQVAQYRLQQLMAHYPACLPHSATLDTFTALPQDVRCIDAAALRDAGAGESGQWLVVAGWECQDLSPAGKGQGLQGPRSNTFFPLVHILAELQQMQQLPPGFLLENVAAQHNHKHPAVSTVDHEAICAVLGEPVTVDAPQFGALAHRLRNYWCNLADPASLRTVVEHVHPPGNRIVNDILDDGRTTQEVRRPDAPPFYPANIPGQPMRALPTLVATPSSYAFRERGAGMLHVRSTGQLVQPNPDERERALGYPTGCTAAPGVTPRQRHAVTGRCMDAFTLRGLMGICIVLHHVSPHLSALKGGSAPGPQADPQLVPKDLLRGPGGRLLRQAGWQQGQPLPAPSALSPIATPLAVALRPDKLRHGLGYSAHPSQPQSAAGEVQHEQGSCSSAHRSEHSAAVTSVSRQQPQAASSHSMPSTSSGSTATAASTTRAVANLPVTTPAASIWSDQPGELSCSYAHGCAMFAHAHQQEASQPVRLRDIWEDHDTLQYLRTGEHPSKDTAARKRVSKRAQLYQFMDGRLQRLMADGQRREVPPPAQRAAVIMQVHNSTGHWGVKRTKHLLQHGYYWNGMEADVHRVLATCEACQQVAASFNHVPGELRPLPIMGLFYRWNCDLCGPFPESHSGNRYCMIMVEGMSKHVELVALPAKEPVHTARAFLASVISRFGACAEVVTDNGTEFDAEFHQLLEECFIDHRHTSPNHPQADGLAERTVQSCKRALTAHVTATAQAKTWDEYMHWLALGYRCSKQSSTGLSPYEMLYGTSPVIPPAIKERFEQPLDLADTDAAADYMLQRAELLRNNTAMAMGNLLIAQQRDKERYKRLRSADYQPRVTKFSAGDFVYRRRYLSANQPTPALQTEARPGIYRVLEVKDSGVLVLQGKDGGTMSEHASNCAPCHLPNIDARIDPSLRRITADFPCSVCNSPEDEDVMLLCDGCGMGFHIYCLEPPLLSVPEDEVWVCPTCVGKGVTVEAAARLQAERVRAQRSASWMSWQSCWMGA